MGRDKAREGLLFLKVKGTSACVCLKGNNREEWVEVIVKRADGIRFILRSQKFGF